MILADLAPAIKSKVYKLYFTNKLMDKSHLCIKQVQYISYCINNKANRYYCNTKWYCVINNYSVDSICNNLSYNFWFIYIDILSSKWKVHAVQVFINLFFN